MSASSDELEAFQDRLVEVDRQLIQLGSVEVKRQDILQSLGTLAKNWLRYSQELRDVDTIVSADLDAFDEQAIEVLRRANVRTRATTYHRCLGPLVANFTDQIIIPLIKFDGSPVQVAARQLANTFTGNLTPDEIGYIAEAVRCVGSKCYRAAMIMLWAAAISRLHQAITSLGFAAYNAALISCSARTGNPYNKLSKSGSQITNLAELQRSRDFDILIIGMDLWNYDLQVFQELERMLGSRNDAAHPGMYTPTVIDVQQFALKLNTYIFTFIKP